MKNIEIENAQTHSADQKALETLVMDTDLEQLEALLDQFNIFEAVGAVRQELRHSDFLSFLLDPHQSHSMGDRFAKKLLQRTLSADHSLADVTPVDFDIWDLTELEVRREWENIDILLLDEPHHLAIAIENKISSNEHSNQLQRYRQSLSQHYGGWRIIGLYLTPEGDEPSDETYFPISYSTVCDLIEGLAMSRASTLGKDVRTLMTHYTQMLRRHIVSESEIASLCQRIYKKHQKALDLIYEHRPDQQGVIRTLLESLVQQTPSLELDHCSKSYIRFAPKDWDVATLKAGKGWTRSGQIALFEFNNSADSLKLKLIIGPGPEETRQKLFNMALENQPPFKTAFKSLNVKWNTIFLRSFLTPKSYEDASDEELENEIRQHWKKFVENDLPAILTKFKAQKWIW